MRNTKKCARRSTPCELRWRPIGAPVILLKGAAYLAMQLPAARGRSFSDVDVLVPKARLSQVESALMQRGWMTTHHSAYDQRYYREWMHELPPLRHLQRQSVLDVHHTILPETARLRPDATLLLSAALPVPGWDGVAVLAPTDMVLHSMTHLFHNDELSRGLRDLSDLDLLLRHFAVDATWWRNLVERARTLDLLSSAVLRPGLHPAHPGHTRARRRRAGLRNGCAGAPDRVADGCAVGPCPELAALHLCQRLDAGSLVCCSTCAHTGCACRRCCWLDT